MHSGRKSKPDFKHNNFNTFSQNYFGIISCCELSVRYLTLEFSVIISHSVIGSSAQQWSACSSPGQAQWKVANIGSSPTSYWCEPVSQTTLYVYVSGRLPWQKDLVIATFCWCTLISFPSDSWELVTEVMKTHTDSHASFLRQRFNDSLMDVRQALAMFKGASSNTAPPLHDHCAQLYTTMRTQLENSATSLQVRLGRFK